MPEFAVPAAALDAAARTLREQAGAPGQLDWDDLSETLRDRWRARAQHVLRAAWPWLAVADSRREVAIEFSYPHWDDGHVETVPHGGPLSRGGDPDEWAAEALASHAQRGANLVRKVDRTVWTGPWRPANVAGSLSCTPESTTVSESSPTTERRPE